MAKAHAHSIIHRDIKPANVMITKDGVVKILDFGIAKLAGGTKLTKTGSTMGTAAYMSPEQVQRMDADHRTDIWSLGVVMYEMLTGKLPFEGDYEQAVMYAIVNMEPARVRNLRSEVSVALGSVIDKCLVKEADERYQSLQDLLSDVQRVRSGERVSAATKISNRKMRRRSLFVGAVLLTVITLVVALKLFVLVDKSKPVLLAPASADANNRIAIFPFTVRGNEKYLYLREGMIDLLHSKLDGAGDLRGVDPSKLLSYIAKDSSNTLDSENASRIAQQLDAGLFVLGSIIEAGGRLEMNASIYSLQDGLKATAQATIVNEAGLMDGVDALARKIVTEQSPYFSQRFAQLAGVTTQSFAALKAYLQGESKLRHAQDFSAKDDFEKAVAEDSTFALAWYRLSQMAGAANLAEPAQYAAQRAAYWRRPLSKRYQQLLQANDAMLRGASGLAERLYRNLTFAYPDDIEAWIGLGRTLFYYNPLYGRSMLESRAAFETAARLDDSQIWTKVFLMNLAVIESNGAELDSLVDVLYGKNSNYVSSYWRVCRALMKNDRVAWQQTVADLRKENDFGVATTTFWATRAWLNGPFFYFENLPSPKDLASLLTASPRSPEYRGLGHLYLAQLKLLQGRWQAAQMEIRNLALLNPAWANEYRALYFVAPFFETPPSELAKLRDDLQAWDAASTSSAMEPLLSLAAHNGVHAHLRLYLLGMLSARLQDQKEVERYAAELTALPAPQRAGSLAYDLILNLRAELAQIRGQQTEALALLVQQKMEVWYDLPWGSPFFAQILARFQRADLLADLGRDEEALNWYNTTVYYPPDWILLAPAYLRRAEIYEKLGRKEEAIEHYRRFIQLWKDCDPELRPTLEQAQQNMMKLQRNL